MYKTTETKQYEKTKMKVQPVRAQATLMQCSEGIGNCTVIHINVDE